MTDIELVIKIPEEVTEYIKNNGCLSVNYLDEVTKAIKDGTFLPKGYGKIGDIDELHNTFKSACNAYNINNLAFISDVDMHFDLASAIIKADKAESEGIT